MTIDKKQLTADLEFIHSQLPADNNDLWEAFDRVLIVIEMLRLNESEQMPTE